MRYFLLLGQLTILFTSCKNFQQTQLDQHAPPNQSLILGRIPASNPLLLNEGGVIDHFNNDKHDWNKQGDSLKVLTMHGCLVLHMDSATGRDFVYRTFNPLNFKKISALSIKFKNLDSSNPPILSILLLDEDKNTGILQTAFPSEGAWVYPLNHHELSYMVSIDRITELRIVPGSLNQTYTGTLYIDEIKGIE